MEREREGTGERYKGTYRGKREEEGAVEKTGKCKTEWPADLVPASSAVVAAKFARSSHFTVELEAKLAKTVYFVSSRNIWQNIFSLDSVPEIGRCPFRENSNFSKFSRYIFAVNSSFTSCEVALLFV